MYRLGLWERGRCRGERPFFVTQEKKGVGPRIPFLGRYSIQAHTPHTPSLAPHHRKPTHHTGHTHTHTPFTRAHLLSPLMRAPNYVIHALHYTPPSITRTTHHLPRHLSSKPTRSAAPPHSRAFSHPLYSPPSIPLRCLSATSALPPLTPRAPSHISHRARRSRRGRSGRRAPSSPTSASTARSNFPSSRSLWCTCGRTRGRSRSNARYIGVSLLG